MFDFGALPPEINSTWMYSGPGAGPMLAAAAGWAGLAADLSSAADSYRAVVGGLTAGSWWGPSAMGMAAAAGQHAGWLMLSAAQAEQTAGQARLAAAAFEAALAMTVPPAEVALNRVQLSVLVATNFFGQNSAAIAATEAQYAVMWVQDAVAMYGYAGASAAAAELTPFAPPPVTTRMQGLANQAGAAAAAAAAADKEIREKLSEFITTVQLALREYLDETDFPIARVSIAVAQWAWTAVSGALSTMKDSMSSVGGAAATAAGGLATGAGLFGAALTGGIGAMSALPSGMAGVSAQLGRAIPVGALSVPPSWSSAVNTMGSAAPAASLLPGARPGLSALPDPGLGAVPGAMLGGMPLAQGRTAQQATRRVPVIPRMPSAG